MEELKETEKKVKKYPTEKLLESKHLKGFQKDFAKVLLIEKEYSIEEAKTLLENAMKKVR